MNIKDNTLIIVPSYSKEKLLLEISSNYELNNIKVMSFNSFLDNFLFTFDEKTIYHLMHKYNIKYDLALMYLNNLRYVENKEYDSSKLNKLVELKNYLDKEKLLSYNYSFQRNLKNKNIIFYNVEKNKFNQYIIDQTKKFTDVEVLDNKMVENYTHEIIEFQDCNEELESVAEKICELLNNSVDIKKIVLLNINDDYLISLKRVFNIFNIPINIPNKNTVLSTKMVSFFLDNLNSDVNITLEQIRDKFDLKNTNNLEIYNQLIDVCNKYSWIDDYLQVKDLLVHDLNTTNVKIETIDNAVRVEDFLEYQPNKEEYVFLVGFNQGIIPKLERDENYISDDIKNEIYLDTTVEKNEFHSKKSLEIIKSIKNLWISYIKTSKQGELQLSTLNNILNYPVIHNNKKYKYSNLNNLLMLGKNLDNYLMYGTKKDELLNLYSNYPNIKYRSFDNKFTGIKENIDSLTLSYSSLDNYYKCAFRYYVASVLKLNVYEENFANYLGSLFHFVLSKRKDLSLDDAWNLFLSDNPKELTNKEKFFLEKGKEELQFIFDVLDMQKDYTNFSDEIYETKIEIDKGDNVKFVGIIDKVMFNDNHDLASIIDYKTGNPHLSLNNLPYGLSLQLPIYLYLLNKSKPDVEVVGFYLQKILPSLIVKDQVKSLKDQKKDLLKLQGYSISNEEKLGQFDKTYVDSSLIKGMKMGSNGFYAYSKTLTATEMNQITELVDKKIDEAINKIKNNNFEINPKHIEKENVGCAFCQFKDVCYMTNKDIVYLEEIKDLTFLGGDNNA